jgi:hypothetical protein
MNTAQWTRITYQSTYLNMRNAFGLVEQNKPYHPPLAALDYSSALLADHKPLLGQNVLQLRVILNLVTLVVVRNVRV